MKIKTLSNNILIEPVKAEEKTKSGVYIPDTERDKVGKLERGIIVGVGESITMLIGEEVFYNKYGPCEVTIDGKEYVVAKEDDIWLKVEK